MIIKALIGLAFLTLFSECDHRGAEERKEMSTDVAKLSRFINLPKQPEEVRWETVERGASGGMGSNDWVLIAVMRFSQKDIDGIISELSGSESEAATLDKSMVFDWYPPELREILTAEAGGGRRIKGKVYDPAPFAKSPLMNGYAVRIGTTNQLFLYLYTT